MNQESSIPNLKYNNLSSSDKLNYLKKYHIEKGISINMLAQTWNTYPNKLFRDCKKLGVKHRNRSEAQKAAFSAGIKAHPTKGKVRTEEEREKIGDAQREKWKSFQ